MLTLTPIKQFPLIKVGDDLAEIITDHLIIQDLQPENGDVIVIAQKVVSKAEGRRYRLLEIDPSDQAIELAAETEKDPRVVQLILNESRSVMRARPGLIIVEHKLGFVCANAGIDHSNVEGGDDYVLLLPENPDRSAHEIREKLQNRFGVRLGVLVIDSHGRAWRNGTLGLVIGLSGVPGVVDKRGEKDLFGRLLESTFIGVADELAAGASLVMGQVAEGTPVVHVRGFPYELRESNLNELLRSQETDLFR